MQHLYFLGLHHPTMAGLAVAAKQLGFAVSGVGRFVHPQLTEQLSAAGIHYFTNYRPDHLDHQSIIIVADNIPAGNPELAAAKKAKLEMISMAQLIQQFTQQQFRIVVLGDALTAVLTAQAMQADQQQATVDFIGSQLVNATNLWPNVAAVHYAGQSQVVIQASMEAAASFDLASQVLYYQPHLLVIADDYSNSSPATHKQLSHLFHDMSQIKTEQKLRLLLPDQQKQLQRLAKQSHLEYQTYGQSTTADWQARKADLDWRKTVFWLYHQQTQIDMLTSSHLGLQGLMAQLASLATASNLDISIEQALLQLGNSNGLYGLPRTIASTPDQPTFHIATDQAVLPQDLWYHLQPIKQAATQHQARLWLICNQDYANQLGSSPHAKQLAKAIDIHIASQDDSTAVTPSSAPISKTHYRMQTSAVGRFIDQNAIAGDQILVIDQPMSGQAQPAWLANLQ